MNSAQNTNDDRRFAKARAASVQRYARTAGVLFLISIVAGAFGEAYVPSRIIVSGDATATAKNIIALGSLFRMGFAGYLAEAVCDVSLALIFYVLLRPVNRILPFSGRSSGSYPPPFSASLSSYIFQRHVSRGSVPDRMVAREGRGRSQVGSSGGLRGKHAGLDSGHEPSFGRGGHRRERVPRVEANRVAGWIDDHSDGSDAVRHVEGEPSRDCSPQLFRFPKQPAPHRRPASEPAFAESPPTAAS
jgi:hypothetical protein